MASVLLQPLAQQHLPHVLLGAAAQDTTTLAPVRRPAPLQDTPRQPQQTNVAHLSPTGLQIPAATTHQQPAATAALDVQTAQKAQADQPTTAALTHHHMIAASNNLPLISSTSPRQSPSPVVAHVVAQTTPNAATAPLPQATVYTTLYAPAPSMQQEQDMAAAQDAGSADLTDPQVAVHQQLNQPPDIQLPNHPLQQQPSSCSSGPTSETTSPTSWQQHVQPLQPLQAFSAAPVAAQQPLHVPPRRRQTQAYQAQQQQLLRSHEVLPQQQQQPLPVPVRRTVYSSIESLGANVQLASPDVGIVKHRSKKHATILLSPAHLIHIPRTFLQEHYCVEHVLQNGIRVQIDADGMLDPDVVEAQVANYTNKSGYSYHRLLNFKSVCRKYLNWRVLGWQAIDASTVRLCISATPASTPQPTVQRNAQHTQQQQPLQPATSSGEQYFAAHPKQEARGGHASASTKQAMQRNGSAESTGQAAAARAQQLANLQHQQQVQLGVARDAAQAGLVMDASMQRPFKTARLHSDGAAPSSVAHASELMSSVSMQQPHRLHQSAPSQQRGVQQQAPVSWHMQAPQQQHQQALNGSNGSMSLPPNTTLFWAPNSNPTPAAAPDGNGGVVLPASTLQALLSQLQQTQQQQIQQQQPAAAVTPALEQAIHAALAKLMAGGTTANLALNTTTPPPPRASPQPPPPQLLASGSGSLPTQAAAGVDALLGLMPLPNVSNSSGGVTGPMPGTAYLARDPQTGHAVVVINAPQGGLALLPILQPTAPQQQPQQLQGSISAATHSAGNHQQLHSAASPGALLAPPTLAVPAPQPAMQALAANPTSNGLVYYTTLPAPQQQPHQQPHQQHPQQLQMLSDGSAVIRAPDGSMQTVLFSYGTSQMGPAAAPNPHHHGAQLLGSSAPAGAAHVMHTSANGLPAGATYVAANGAAGGAGNAAGSTRGPRASAEGAQGMTQQQQQQLMAHYVAQQRQLQRVA